MSEADSSAIQSYVNRVISRALFDKFAADIGEEQAVDMLKLPLLMRARCSQDPFEEFQPVNLREDRALAAAMSASHKKEYFKLPGFMQNFFSTFGFGEETTDCQGPSELLVRACAHQHSSEVQEARLKRGAPQEGRATSVFTTIAGAANNGIVTVDKKLNSLAEACNGLVPRLDSVTDSCIAKFDKVVNSGSMTSTTANSYQKLGSSAQKYSQHLGNFASDKASSIASKARVVSEKAADVCARTKLAHDVVPDRGVKKRLKTAFGKDSLRSTKLSGHGGA